MFCFNGHICKMIKVGVVCLLLIQFYPCFPIRRCPVGGLSPVGHSSPKGAGFFGVMVMLGAPPAPWDTAQLGRCVWKNTVSICNCKGHFSCSAALPVSDGLKPFQTLQKSLGALFKRKIIIFNGGILKLEIIKLYCIFCLITGAFCCCCFQGM